MSYYAFIGSRDSMWMSLGAIILPSTTIIHCALLSDSRISKLPQRPGLSHPLCAGIHEPHTKVLVSSLTGPSPSLLYKVIQSALY